MLLDKPQLTTALDLAKRSIRYTEHGQRIRDFMKLAGQECPPKPTLPSEEVRKLRARLILEEALETITALGIHVMLDGVSLQQRDYELVANCEPNLVEIVDGCADISVVTIGTLIACGVPDDPILREVDLNNLAKFGPGGYRDAGGKWIKPPNHQPPRIGHIIDVAFKVLDDKKE